MPSYKIAFIITGLGMGGAENQVCALADKLSQHNDVIIISLSDEKNILIRPKNKKIKIISLGMNKTPWSFIYALLTAKRVIKEHKIDILHGHMFHANIFSRILRFFYREPILITTAHNSNEGGKIRMLIYKLTDSLSTISTNVSQEAVSSFVTKGAVNANRMITMYNGIDTSTFSYSEFFRINKRKTLSIPEDTPLLLSVGRLTEAKDYPNLLNAFSSINNSYLPHLIIIGDGENKSDLIILAKKLNIEDRVHWLGIRNDVHEWMSACDIFVLSSAWEGFGLVLAEAMSCQRVVIGTNCGGVKEVINNYGFLVSPRSTLELTINLEKALNLSHAEKTKIGINARNHIEKNFSIDSIVNKWMNLYSSLLKNK